MKKLSSFLTCFIISSSLLAQSNNTLVYGEIGGGVGNYRSFKGGVDVIFDGNNILTPCMYFNGRRAPNTPSDYQRGFLSGYPQQEFELFGLMYGKIIYTENPNIRIALRGGIMIGDYETPYDFNSSGETLLGPNYSYQYNHQLTGAVLLNPVLELPFSRHFGFSFGLFSLINGESSTVGGEANMIFGHVRNRSSHIINKQVE